MGLEWDTPPVRKCMALFESCMRAHSGTCPAFHLSAAPTYNSANKFCQPARNLADAENSEQMTGVTQGRKSCWGGMMLPREVKDGNARSWRL